MRQSRQTCLLGFAVSESLTRRILRPTQQWQGPRAETEIRGSTTPEQVHSAPLCSTSSSSRDSMGRWTHSPSVRGTQPANQRRWHPACCWSHMLDGVHHAFLGGTRSFPKYSRVSGRGRAGVRGPTSCMGANEDPDGAFFDGLAVSLCGNDEHGGGCVALGGGKRSTLAPTPTHPGTQTPAEILNPGSSHAAPALLPWDLAQGSCPGPLTFPTGRRTPACAMRGWWLRMSAPRCPRFAPAADPDACRAREHEMGRSTQSSPAEIRVVVGTGRFENGGSAKSQVCRDDGRAKIAIRVTRE